MAMKRKDRDDWVAALRSGRYKKGTGRLCQWVDGPGIDEESVEACEWCCLGVLADVVAVFDWEFSEQSARYGVPRSLEGYRHKPVDFSMYGTEVGLTKDQLNFLAALNDGTMFTNSIGTVSAQTNATFVQIADWIERNVRTVD